MITYRGTRIYRCNVNSSGMRYFAYLNSRIIRADTLRGIKNLIMFLM